MTVHAKDPTENGRSLCGRRNVIFGPMTHDRSCKICRKLHAEMVDQQEKLFTDQVIEKERRL